MKAIVGGKIYHKNRFIEDAYLIYDERIAEIGRREDFSPEAVEEILELDDELLVPGFIDVHIHGFAGSDAMDGEVEALETIARSIVQYGVSSFLPTTMTGEKKALEKSLKAIRRLQEGKVAGGARILGAHVEGPFISANYPGAQAKDHIVDFTANEAAGLVGLFAEYRDVIKIMTIAPEISGALDYISGHSSDIIFSLGHTAASFATAAEAFAKGARGVSHLFNAMAPFHHREPGLIGAALGQQEVYTELICDGIHVHPAVYELLLQQKGNRRILLISDAMRGGGLADGVYEFGGQAVSVEKGSCCLLESGRLAGSVLNLNQALKNFRYHTSLSLDELIPLTAENQAEYLGLDNIIGKIEPGFFADITILSKDLDVLRTIIGGKTVFAAHAA